MRMPSGPEGANLSSRELECLRWASEGKSAWETAKVCGITERTVIAHLVNATMKLGASNKLHAVVLAMRAGHLQ